MSPLTWWWLGMGVILFLFGYIIGRLVSEETFEKKLAKDVHWLYLPNVNPDLIGGNCSCGNTKCKCKH